MQKLRLAGDVLHAAQGAEKPLFSHTEAQQSPSVWHSSSALLAVETSLAKL